MAVRMKMTVAYLGTPFHGWQRQLDQRTVQGELEDALGRMLGLPRLVAVGAGRTDAGVHAAGQVAHADLAVRIPSYGMLKALNTYLPPEIRVRQAREVQSSFHARGSACGKVYVYRAAWRGSELPWRGLRTAVVRAPVTWDELEQAVAMLPGRRDMGSFSVPCPELEGHERTLFEARLERRADGLVIRFVGDGFLRYQVRRMVGAVLEVGWGRRGLGELSKLLAEPRPGSSIWTAPARGLTLEKVLYRPLRVTGGPVVDSVLADGERPA